jgi:hypothetical protein
LTEAQPTFGPSRHGEGWTFNEVHRRHKPALGAKWLELLKEVAPAVKSSGNGSWSSLGAMKIVSFCIRLRCPKTLCFI